MKGEEMGLSQVVIFSFSLIYSSKHSIVGYQIFFPLVLHTQKKKQKSVEEGDVEHCRDHALDAVCSRSR